LARGTLTPWKGNRGGQKKRPRKRVKSPEKGKAERKSKTGSLGGGGSKIERKGGEKTTSQIKGGKKMEKGKKGKF